MSVLPKSQVPDKSAGFNLVLCFCERAGMSDQKLFCYPTNLNDVSVGNIRHSSVQSPRKSLIYIYIYIYIHGVPGGMCETSGECSLC